MGEIIAQDEQRAAFLNTAKAVIEAEHLQLVRRVFKGLSDPLPAAAVIRAAFKADPEFKTLTGRNADQVMKLIIERCRYNGWRIPEELRGLEHWGTLFVKWHWFCSDRLKLVGPDALPRQWEGKAKALVEKAHPLLKPPKKRKPSRNYWFDHAPFRLMFGNQTCGKSWLKEEFAASRTFILLDPVPSASRRLALASEPTVTTPVAETATVRSNAILIGIVPRDSRFSPYTLPDAQPGEESLLLYEESQGEAPRLRAVSKERIVLPARKGLVFLFDLDGKAIRGKSNLNALYLRALFSAENLKSRDLHLDGNAEFHVRKGTDIPRDGKSAHFRQRFTEDRLFVTLRLPFNAPMVATGTLPQAFGSLANHIARHPDTKFIAIPTVPSASSPTGAGQFVGDLARRVIAEDACVIFAPDTPKRLLTAVREKFEYIVLKDRALTEDGGALRGYQLADRLFVGSIKAANEELKVREAEAAAQAERAARKAEARAKAELGRRRAILRKNCLSPNFALPIFKEGVLRFKVEYRTSDNVRHEVECRADSRDEMFAKARSIGVRPGTVTQLDPAPTSAKGEAESSPLDEIATRLQRLDALMAQGLLAEAEYAAQRAKILAEL